ncbi:MAG: HepT-like ribonuclease domain-containing protein [Bacteroidia bacterium]
MTRNSKKYLFDILSCIKDIQNQHLFEVQNIQDFENDKTIMRAVERELEIIGEAAYRLRQMGVNLMQADSLINRRNTIIHQYDSFQPRTIWYFIKQQLPELETEVQDLLKSNDE